MSLEEKIEELVNAKCAVDEAVQNMNRSVAAMRKFFYWTIGILAAAIMIAVITTTKVETRQTGYNADLEWLRLNSTNKKAVQGIQNVMNVWMDAYEKLETDPYKKEMKKYFNTELRKAMDGIVSWNTEIEPRGRVEARNKAGKSLTLNQ